MIEILPNWHPIFVHFAVALWTLAVALHFMVFALPGGKTRQEIGVVARWLLWLGAVFGVITALAGWQAFNSVVHDETSHAVMEEHRNLALLTLVLFVVAAGWSLWRRRAGRTPGKMFLLLLLVAGGFLSSAAWHGGELVYRYGLGVMSLPQPEVEGGHEHHSHSHMAPSNDEMRQAMPAAPAGTEMHDHTH